MTALGRTSESDPREQGTISSPNSSPKQLRALHPRRVLGPGFHHLAPVIDLVAAVVSPLHSVANCMG
jgi:hypothetical protein